MSKSAREIAAEVEQGAHLEPIVEGVKAIGAHVEKSEKRVNALVEKLEKDVNTKVKDLEDKTEKGFNDVVDSIERLGKRSSAFNRTAIEDLTEPLQAALPEDIRKTVPHWYGVARGFKGDSKLRDPLIMRATGRYFALSTKLQLRQFAKEHHKVAAELDTLTKAFEDSVTKAAYAEGSGTGDELVPTIVASEILRLILDAGRIFPRCRQFPMTTEVHNVPAQNAAVTVNWAAEAGALTGGEGTFAEKVLTSKKVFGRATMSIEVVEDSNPGLIAYLLEVFSEGIARALDLEVVEGTQFTDDLDGAAGNRVTTAALSYAKLVETMTGGGESNTWESGVWIMNATGWAAVLGLTDTPYSGGGGLGQPIVRFGTVEGSPAMTLFGRPVIVHNALTAGTNYNIYFGDLMKYIAGTRQGLRWDVTDQVNWANYQMDARLVGRFAGVCGVPAAFTVFDDVT